MNVLSDSILIKFQPSTGKLEIHALYSDLKRPAVEIACDTRNGMSFEELSKFIGERIVILSPSLRKEYEDYLWSPDGSPPKKAPSEGR